MGEFSGLVRGKEYLKVLQSLNIWPEQTRDKTRDLISGRNSTLQERCGINIPRQEADDWPMDRGASYIYVRQEHEDIPRKPFTGRLTQIVRAPDLYLE